MTRAVATLTLLAAAWSTPGQAVSGTTSPAPVVSRPPAPAAPVAVRASLPPLPAMAAVRWCESRDDYGAENPTSSASGAFQFIASTFEATTGLPAPASAYPKSVQDWAFRKLWADGAGKRHWNPSKFCWSELLAVTS